LAPTNVTTLQKFNLFSPFGDKSQHRSKRVFSTALSAGRTTDPSEQSSPRSQQSDEDEMQDNRRQQLGLRLDPATMERLEALSHKTGTPITTLGREILQSALRDDSQAEQTALLETAITQLDRLEHNVATHLPALHQRLGRLEQLVCAVDANAARRAPVEHMKLRHLWRNQRYALFELQGSVRARGGNSLRL